MTILNFAYTYLQSTISGLIYMGVAMLSMFVILSDIATMPLMFFILGDAFMVSILFIIYDCLTWTHLYISIVKQSNILTP